MLVKFEVLFTTIPTKRVIKAKVTTTLNQRSYILT
uniref:Uncharacterized protein n=1 Tax=viral metagenome TaxID=1070528 RepID=A0A6C0EL04_9ZZZZ